MQNENGQLNYFEPFNDYNLCSDNKVTTPIVKTYSRELQASYKCPWSFGGLIILKIWTRIISSTSPKKKIMYLQKEFQICHSIPLYWSHTQKSVPFGIIFGMFIFDENIYYKNSVSHLKNFLNRFWSSCLTFIVILSRWTGYWILIVTKIKEIFESLLVNICCSWNCASDYLCLEVNDDLFKHGN